MRTNKVSTNIETLHEGRYPRRSVLLRSNVGALPWPTTQASALAFVHVHLRSLLYTFNLCSEQGPWHPWLARMEKADKICLESTLSYLE